MATVAALNVEISTRIGELQKGLKDAARELENAAKQFGAAGKRAGESYLKNISDSVGKASSSLADASMALSSRLSLPIAAFGVAAIKSAGEIEALRKAMEATFLNAGRTIGEAGDELEALRRAAEAPGLDFPEAVKGSIRLQNVGLNAEAARATIIELANAVATTGGSAENLAEVTNQFSQMISKGKIYNEDLKIIKGQMPVLAGLMEKTFGTTQAEKLQEMGISGREFVDKMTIAMQGLNRAEGGISNAIVNAGTSIKMFLATVGESMNKTFDVTGKLEAFAKWMDGLASYFKNLDEGTKKAIGAVAVFAITLGPLLKVGQGAVMVVGQMIKGFQFLQLVLTQSLAGQAIPSAIAAFKALSLATKLTILGAAIGVILAAAAAFQVLKTDMSAAAVAARSIENVNKTAADAIAGQKSEVDTLVAAYKAEGTTLEQKKQILTKLNQISPEYFNGLKVGKDDVTALTMATAKYSAELLNVARITAAKDRLVEIERAMLDLNKSAEPSVWQTLGNAITGFGNVGAYASNQAQSFTKNFKDQKEVLEAEREALLGIVVAQTKVDATTGKLTSTTKTFSETAKRSGKILQEVLSDVANAPSIASAIGDDADVATIKALENGIKKLIDEGFKPASSEVQGLKSQLDALKGSVVSVDIIKKNVVSGDESGGIQPVTSLEAPTLPGPPTITGEALTKAQEKAQAYADAIKQIQYDLTVGNETFAASFQAASDLVSQNGTLMQNIFVGMGEAIMQTAAAGKTSLTDFANAATAAAAKIIKSYIQQGVAAAVSRALGTGIFPYNLILGGIAGAAASALFTKAIGAIGVKGFANGTNYAPGGMALVGEQGPELVNLPTGSQVFSNPRTRSMLNGRGGENREISLTGEFALFGSDLLLMIERAKRKNDRLR